MPKTMYEKIFENHLVYSNPDATSIIYVDRQLIHEVTSPQAFDALRTAKRKVRCPPKTFATVDHNVSTRFRSL